MPLKMISTENAPKAVGPYSQAVQAGNILFCSGQLPIDPKSGELKLFGGNAAEQAKLVMNNLKEVLAAEGLTFNDVAKTTIFLSDMNNFGAVNEVYASYFGEYKPARACIAVKSLPKNVDVEIEAIAYYG
ncbi:MAG TPA: RidA family protein [bacterium]|nr:RidA family protein [Myxococcales bacterium]OQA62369.1 MAG: Enamine/imine deaminase [bacterium ADurb.Bin270]HPW45867.1 RidA family protein [bacterium]HQG12993.1 RidA family protein [bacterium]HQH80142.1 RidA family protein [bacterium]